MQTNQIYNESCLETLKRMPDDFLDCVITSPPYYGLRSYNTEPQIWGGDENCQHQWGESLPFAKQDNRTAEEKAAQGAQVGSNINFNEETTTATSGAFCSCGAWLGELGLEPTFQLYLSHLLDIFREVKRVLKPTGTVWVNLGDSYSGSNGNGYKQTLANTNASNGLQVNQDFRKMTGKIDLVRPKSLMNIPHRFYIAMTDELGMIQRNNIVWHKPACMPSSAKDRFTVDFENIGFFTKNEKYYFEQQLEPLNPITVARNAYPHNGGGDYAMGRERDVGEQCNDNGRNMRSTWSINFEPSGDEHYASYPTRLVERMMRAGCPADGIVYDPFGGTATTAVVAHRLGRQWICSELQPKYVEISENRLEPLLNQNRLFV